MNEQSEINKHTKITASLATVILVFIVGLAVTCIGEWDAARSQISELQKTQWTVNDQLRWTSEMQKKNPDLDVPIPDISSQAAAAGYLAMFETNRLKQ